MQHQPVFTQKHYEYLIKHMEQPAPETVQALCAVFAKDNPAFRRDKFTRLMLRKWERKNENA
jgi:hypothetical protein